MDPLLDVRGDRRLPRASAPATGARPLFHFVLHALPKETLPDTAGAFVSCWIDFRQRDGAELLARHYVEQSGWTPGELEEVRWCEEAHYAGTPELRYFREAQQDGASFVYHRYPPVEGAG